MSSSSPSGSGGDLTERRGIPAAKFIQDVETYLSQSGLDPNSALAFHQERFLLFIFSLTLSSHFHSLSLRIYLGLFFLSLNPRSSVLIYEYIYDQLSPESLLVYMLETCTR